MLRVGRHENIFYFIFIGNKNCRVGAKTRVGRVSGNTAIFCLRLIKTEIMGSFTRKHFVCFKTIGKGMSLSVSSDPVVNVNVQEAI